MCRFPTFTGIDNVQLVSMWSSAGGSERERCVFAHVINEHVVTFQYVQEVADEHAKHVSGVFSSR